MSQEAQLAIPAMWSAEARGVMSRAAYKAGFKNVNLREEPQCVAGACMSDLRDQGLIDVRLHRQRLNPLRD
jgi:molecular chaperone DnaK (HSP70)